MIDSFPYVQGKDSFPYVQPPLLSGEVQPLFSLLCFEQGWKSFPLFCNSLHCSSSLLLGKAANQEIKTLEFCFCQGCGKKLRPSKTAAELLKEEGDKRLNLDPSLHAPETNIDTLNSPN